VDITALLGQGPFCPFGLSPRVIEYCLQFTRRARIIAADRQVRQTLTRGNPCGAQWRDIRRIRPCTAGVAADHFVEYQHAAAYQGIERLLPSTRHAASGSICERQHETEPARTLRTVRDGFTLRKITNRVLEEPPGAVLCIERRHEGLQRMPRGGID